MQRNIIAILRGVQPQEVEDIVGVLLEKGINKIEVPLNSPQPFSSISRVVKRFKGEGIFGAGTVLNVDEVSRLSDIGANFVVSPNCDIQVITKTKKLNMLSYPGVMTPTDCFAALKAGADGLKFFPGEIIGPQGAKAIKVVLPLATECIAVGGVNASNMAAWMKVGIYGFGLGSALYKVGDQLEDIRKKAEMVVASYDSAVFNST